MPCQIPRGVQRLPASLCTVVSEASPDRRFSGIEGSRVFATLCSNNFGIRHHQPTGGGKQSARRSPFGISAQVNITRQRDAVLCAAPSTFLKTSLATRISSAVPIEI